jgi:hypothetical protein
MHRVYVYSVCTNPGDREVRRTTQTNTGDMSCGANVTTGQARGSGIERYALRGVVPGVSETGTMHRSFGWERDEAPVKAGASSRLLVAQLHLGLHRQIAKPY